MVAINSEVIPFFKDKNIFLTGGTGFVGKLLIDQLLRKCEPNKIYLLIRSKKGVEPKQRLEQLFQDVVYERLKNEKPGFIEKVQLINGNVSEDDLGLNKDSLVELIENVNIVIHGAAVVKFEEPLQSATNINVKGTLSIIKLCHRIKNLNALVYVSTAYSNCPYREIKEEFYDTPIDPDKLIKIVENSSNEELEILLPKIIGNWPNVYIFTKAVAENGIKILAKDLPVSIIRPGMISSTLREPIPGWMDNLYGPAGLVAAVSYGVLRVARTDYKDEANLVPGDMVASSILAAVTATSKKRSHSAITIYNYVAHRKNPLTWGTIGEKIQEIGNEIPLENSVWLPFYTLQSNIFLYYIFSFFLHFMPALLIDIAFLLLNKKMRALKLYRKSTKFLNILEYFSIRRWKFYNDNVQDLWEGLTSEDKQMFFFDMASIDWLNYLTDVAVQGRVHIFKETPDNLPQALKKQRRRQLFQNTIFTFLFGCMVWILYKYLLNLFTTTEYEAAESDVL